MCARMCMCMLCLCVLFVISFSHVLFVISCLPFSYINIDYDDSVTASLFKIEVNFTYICLDCFCSDGAWGKNTDRENYHHNSQ